jgi:hypothetical protein
VFVAVHLFDNEESSFHGVVHRMQREIIHSLSSNKFLFAKKKSFTHDRNMNVFVVVPLFDNEESSFHGSAM